MPMERWVVGAPMPDAPLYDLEETDALGLVTRVLATGITAEQALKFFTMELLLDATEIR